MSMAMLGFNAEWATIAEKKAAQRKAKVKAGTVYLNREELEAMSVEEIKGYQSRIQDGASPSMALITAVSLCQQVINEKEAK